MSGRRSSVRPAAGGSQPRQRSTSSDGSAAAEGGQGGMRRRRRLGAQEICSKGFGAQSAGQSQGGGGGSRRKAGPSGTTLGAAAPGADCPHRSAEEPPGASPVLPPCPCGAQRPYTSRFLSNARGFEACPAHRQCRKVCRLEGHLLRHAIRSPNRHHFRQPCSPLTENPAPS